VEKPLENVEHLVDRFRLDLVPCDSVGQRETGDVLTRLGRIGATAPKPPVDPDTSRSALSEEALLRGYGHDPSDIERELIER